MTQDLKHGRRASERDHPADPGTPGRLARPARRPRGPRLWRRPAAGARVRGEAAQPDRNRAGRWTVVVAALALAGLLVWSAESIAPPRARTASSPTEEFSAERAFEHVQRIATQPHPVGSAANAQVRDYLVGQLRRLGLNPTIQKGE